jgi:Septum formation
MASPTGVSSGSVPEPRVPPEASATEPTALAPADPELAHPEPSGPAPTEAPAEDAVVAADPDPGPPADERAGQARGVSWLVTAGVVILVLALAAAAGALYVTTHGFRSKTVVTYRPAAVFSLRPGDCLNSSQNGLSVTVLSCATPHEAEVFATFSLTGSSWPGSAAVQQQASSGCADRIAGYMNPQLLNAGLTEQYVYPNQKAWQAGVRTVVCEVSSSTGPLTGSVRSAG